MELDEVIINKQGVKIYTAVLIITFALIWKQTKIDYILFIFTIIIQEQPPLVIWKNSAYFGAIFIHQNPINNIFIKPYLKKCSLISKFIISPNLPDLIQTTVYSNITSFVI